MNTSSSERMLNASRKRSLRFQRLLGVSVAFLMSVLLSPGFVRAENAIIVKEGKPLMARYRGAAWQETADGLAAHGINRFLYAGCQIGAGDFCITARLKLGKLDGTAASFVLDGSHVGFDGRGNTLFVEGPLFGGKTTLLEPAEKYLHPGRTFNFDVIRENKTTRFLIDGKEFHRKENWNGPVEHVGFRSWRNEMSIEQFGIQGTLTESPSPVGPIGHPLFISGQGGYHTYRIPALVVTTQGTVLAFCEGRKDHRRRLLRTSSG